MEYPFFKCPSPNTNQNQNFTGSINYSETESVSASSASHPDSPELIVKLIKQSLKIQEECMTLLNLLVEFVEFKETPNDDEPHLIPFEKKNRLFK